MIRIDLHSRDTAAALFFAATFATPAFAENERVWPGTVSSDYQPSYVRIHEPTAPNAVATVTFNNQMVHAKDDTFQITYGEITIRVFMDWYVNADGDERVTVEAPEGYVAVPRHITVPETLTDVIHIFEWTGM
ncbi:MAG: hypothetical protein AAGK79_17380 [Pseudomonadota bacterium]